MVVILNLLIIKTQNCIILNEKKLLLICGCPRSGTTLLNILLNSHPNISITNELDLYKLSFDLNHLLFFKHKKRSNASFNRPKSIRENWSDKDVLSYTPSIKKYYLILSIITALVLIIKKT